MSYAISAHQHILLNTALPHLPAHLPLEFRMNSERFTGHSSMLIAGWSDASSGPMIPFIQVSSPRDPLGGCNAVRRAFFGSDHSLCACRLSTASVTPSVSLHTFSWCATT